MSNWKTTCQWVAIVSLLFLGIPIKIQPPDERTREHFDSYIFKFNKTYQNGTDEYNKRYEAFKLSLSQVDEYNAQHSGESARYGLTRFSDLTPQEFSERWLDPRYPQRVSPRLALHLAPSPHVTRMRRQLAAEGLPLQVDWRTKGVISDVRDQGLCGACWAFSTVLVAEAMATKYNNYTRYSTQQMVDCARNGNMGCQGGDICSLLQWLNMGVTLQHETVYPPTLHAGPCRNVSAPGLRLGQFDCRSEVGTEETVLRWLATQGPVAVAVNALSWQHYLGGVLQHHCPNGPLDLNHAVALVGYDLQHEVPHYIARNSWGRAFGQAGDLRLAYGGNTCGLAHEVAMINVIPSN